MPERGPRCVEQYASAEQGRIGSLDGHGREINELYICTVTTRSGRRASVRFGATDLDDATAGTEEFARSWFEEIARESLAYAPEARPHPDDTTVRITLSRGARGEEHSFDYPIPAESQPNAERSNSDIFYRI